MVGKYVRSGGPRKQTNDDNNKWN